MHTQHIKTTERYAIEGNKSKFLQFLFKKLYSKTPHRNNQNITHVLYSNYLLNCVAIDQQESL